MRTAACTYGLQAALYLADVANNNKTGSETPYVPVRTISEALDIPHYFLAKVLHTMAEEHILISHRGQGGGVALARRPEEFTLSDIATVFDEDPPLHACPVGLPDCERSQCRIDRRCDRARRDMRDIFEHTTLAEAARQALTSKSLTRKPKQTDR